MQTNETKENIWYTAYNMLIVRNILKDLLFEKTCNRKPIHTTEDLLQLITSTTFSASTLSSTQPSEKGMISSQLSIEHYLDTKCQDPSYPLYKTNQPANLGNKETVYAFRPEYLSTMKSYKDVKTLLTSFEASPFFLHKHLQTNQTSSAIEDVENDSTSKTQYLFFLQQRQFILALFKKLTPGFETTAIVTSARSK